MSTAKKVLIISHDKVGPSMAGPGIRYHQIAIELSKTFDVTLAVFNPTYVEGLKNTPYEFTDIKVFEFQNEFIKYDVIFALWLSEDMISFAHANGIGLVFDLYAPVPVEELVARMFSGRTSASDDHDYLKSVKHYRGLMAGGDYFTCSNPIQKDFWTGFAFASDATSPAKYIDKPLYERIGLVPMGINLAELENRKAGYNPLFKRIPRLNPDDFIFVWTGGIWDWFDGKTTIEAMRHLQDANKSHIKLVFLGTKHPNDDVPAMKETKEAFLLAQKLGLLDKSVFFLEGWIPYAERIDYLLAAHAAIYAHKPSIEARFSHRTRVLDHILTCLPTIATAGDFLGEELAAKNMGVVTPPLNAKDLSKTMASFAEDKKFYESLKNSILENQTHYTWQESIKPLKQFIEEYKKPAVELSQKPTHIDQTKSLKKRLKKHIPQRFKDRIKRLVLD